MPTNLEFIEWVTGEKEVRRMEVQMVSAAELAAVLSRAESQRLGQPVRFDAHNVERFAAQRQKALEAYEAQRAYVEARRARSREKSRRCAANKAARAAQNRMVRFARGGKAKAR